VPLSADASYTSRTTYWCPSHCLSTSFKPRRLGGSRRAVWPLLIQAKVWSISTTNQLFQGWPHAYDTAEVDAHHYQPRTLQSCISTPQDRRLSSNLGYRSQSAPTPTKERNHTELSSGAVRAWLAKIAKSRTPLRQHRQYPHPFFIEEPSQLLRVPTRWSSLTRRHWKVYLYSVFVHPMP
jgi:hypothetical protein